MLNRFKSVCLSLGVCLGVCLSAAAEATWQTGRTDTAGIIAVPNMFSLATYSCVSNAETTYNKPQNLADGDLVTGAYGFKQYAVFVYTFPEAVPSLYEFRAITVAEAKSYCYLKIDKVEFTDDNGVVTAYEGHSDVVISPNGNWNAYSSYAWFYDQTGAALASNVKSVTIYFGKTGMAANIATRFTELEVAAASHIKPNFLSFEQHYRRSGTGAPENYFKGRVYGELTDAVVKIYYAKTAAELEDLSSCAYVTADYAAESALYGTYEKTIALESDTQYYLKAVVTANGQTASTEVVPYRSINLERTVFGTGGDYSFYATDNSGDYVHVFTNTASAMTFVSPATVATDIRFLVLGGGGGGGGGSGTGWSAGGGGGGAGGLLEGTVNVLAGTSCGVTVGAGGSGGVVDATRGSENVLGKNGADTLLIVDATSYVGNGGGGGRTVGFVGSAGGNAGQGCTTATQLDLDGETVIGHIGSSVGGGGAGGDGTSTGGGPGKASSITGESILYGGGGGGGQNSGGAAGYGSAGGEGGGGDGGGGSSHAAGNPGTDGLGGGGGGGKNGNAAANTGGRGGDGIVIIRYRPAVDAMAAVVSVSDVHATYAQLNATVTRITDGETTADIYAALRESGSGSSFAYEKAATGVAENETWSRVYSSLAADTAYEYSLLVSNSVRGVAYNGSFSTLPEGLPATGGERRLLDDGSYVHVYEEAGEFTFKTPDPFGGNIEYFIVGGGGAGQNGLYGNPSWGGGGGSAGSVITGKVTVVEGGRTFAVVVGAGGAHGTGNNVVGSDGGSSSVAFATTNLVAAGGAHGYCYRQFPAIGGAGAGGANSGITGGPGVYSTLNGYTKAADTYFAWGGDGGQYGPTSPTVPGADGTDGRGSGGEGGHSRDINEAYIGGNGGCGCVVLRYIPFGGLPESPSVSLDAVTVTDSMTLKVDYDVIHSGKGATTVDLYLLYGTSESALTGQQKIATGVVGSGSVTVDVLVPETTMYFRLKADNGAHDALSDAILSAKAEAKPQLGSATSAYRSGASVVFGGSLEDAGYGTLAVELVWWYADDPTAQNRVTVTGYDPTTLPCDLSCTVAGIESGRKIGYKFVATCAFTHRGTPYEFADETASGKSGCWSFVPASGSMAYNTITDGDWVLKVATNELEGAAEDARALTVNGIWTEGRNTDLDFTQPMEGAHEIVELGGFSATAVTSVKWPLTLKYLSASAFLACSSLTNVTALPASFAAYRANAGWTRTFQNCALLDVDIADLMPAQIVSVGNAQFAGCSKIHGVLSLPDNFSSTIRGEAFSGTAISGVLVLPSTVEDVAGSAFSGTKITSADLNKVRTIGDRAFYGCSELTTVNALSVTNVGAHAFAMNVSLEVLSFGDSPVNFLNATAPGGDGGSGTIGAAEDAEISFGLHAYTCYTNTYRLFTAHLPTGVASTAHPLRLVVRKGKCIDEWSQVDNFCAVEEADVERAKASPAGIRRSKIFGIVEDPSGVRNFVIRGNQRPLTIYFR